MREVVVYALLVWIVVSLVIGMVRVIGQARRSPARSTVSTDYLADYPADQTPASDPSQAHPDAHEAPVAVTPVDSVVDSVVGSGGNLPSERKREPDTVRVPPGEVRPPDLDALPPPPVALGVPTPGAPTAPMAAPRDLPALLAGIRLPCDLLPVIPDDHRSPDQHVSLMTSSAPAEIVGPAVADELERLGYALEPLSESELLATREGDTLTLGIVTMPELSEVGGRRTYPTAVDGDIVITVDTAG